MKRRLLALVLTLTFAISGVLTGCGAKSGKLVVGASASPHAEILKEVQSVLKEKGIELEIKEFSDYVLPNTALDDKSLDANFFQHKPYLDNFNAEHKTDIVSAAQIHYETFGLYPGKLQSLAAIGDGTTIAVPNDTSNEARALLLLQTIGLIKVNPAAGFNATVKDITENTKNIKIKELEAAQLTRALPDVDFAIINGNYAIQAGFNVVTDALAKEEADSVSAQTYANIIAVRKGDENRDDIKALIEALKSDKIKKFIEDKYKGAVVPIF
jgi:D-methionine transport system substrate-binding protein